MKRELKGAAGAEVQISRRAIVEELDNLTTRWNASDEHLIPTFKDIFAPIRTNLDKIAKMETNPTIFQDTLTQLIKDTPPFETRLSQDITTSPAKEPPGETKSTEMESNCIIFQDTTTRQIKDMAVLETRLSQGITTSATKEPPGETKSTEMESNYIIFQDTITQLIKDMAILETRLSQDITTSAAKESPEKASSTEEEALEAEVIEEVIEGEKTETLTEACCRLQLELDAKVRCNEELASKVKYLEERVAALEANAETTAWQSDSDICFCDRNDGCFNVGWE
ncbi:hypothetical protein N7466_011333 [Penicillium verhagenii]|uniref:uncharacterized protein n=1 Tax=Penicillium verhagenii TaxID=1562060 RepID=UPI0025459FED|nr:uncharacterized protein N7466_011333 [Penicillium verhagenii]KAJ5915400.1 hypothetical protein N7466_011333 [Penicillium verhagenii]